MKKYVKIKDFCGVVMPSQIDNILQFNQYMKSDKISYIIYADFGTLIKKQMNVQIIQKNLQQQR